MKILNQHKISRAPNTEFIEFLCVPKISDWPVNSDIIMVRHGEAFFEVGGWYVIISAPYSPSVRAFRKSGSSGVGWVDLYDPSDPNGVNWVWGRLRAVMKLLQSFQSQLTNLIRAQNYDAKSKVHESTFEVEAKILSPKGSREYWCPLTNQFSSSASRPWVWSGWKKPQTTKLQTRFFHDSENVVHHWIGILSH